MSKVWFVTGSASGLGRDVVNAALESGARVFATARGPHRLDDLIERFGDRIRAAELDVVDEGASVSAVAAAVESFDKLDGTRGYRQRNRHALRR
jgi:NADP-dependent 3-hydroxy acid dehydrogenase YdfG